MNKKKMSVTIEKGKERVVIQQKRRFKQRSKESLVFRDAGK